MITGNKFFGISYQRYTESKRRVVTAPTSEVVYAYVNHGRWVVDCPWCSGAEFAFEEGAFFCESCRNAGAGGKPIRALFPATRQAIERALDGRPVQNRNWRPGESLQQLRAENIEHGLENP